MSLLAGSSLFAGFYAFHSNHTIQNMASLAAKLFGVSCLLAVIISFFSLLFLTRDFICNCKHYYYFIMIIIVTSITIVILVIMDY